MPWFAYLWHNTPWYYHGIKLRMIFYWMENKQAGKCLWKAEICTMNPTMQTCPTTAIFTSRCFTYHLTSNLSLGPLHVLATCFLPFAISFLISCTSLSRTYPSTMYESEQKTWPETGVVNMTFIEPPVCPILCQGLFSLSHLVSNRFTYSGYFI